MEGTSFQAVIIICALRSRKRCAAGNIATISRLITTEANRKKSSSISAKAFW